MTGRSPRSVDVVVIGGGPAGTAAALWCVNRGLSVTLVERERFPRHRPGETLPPAVEVLFDQLGVSDAIAQSNFLRHEGVWSSWAGPRRFVAFGSDAGGPWRGYQTPRDRLDSILLAAAVDAGVVLEQPAHATDLLSEGGRVTGIATTGISVAAKWVVDAGGGQHWLARRLSIPRRCLSPRLIAWHGYARGTLPNLLEEPEIRADEHGWTWTAQIAADLFQWTRMSFEANAPGRATPPAVLNSLTALGRPRGADVQWRIVERPAGFGYLCCGDAAAVLDPASSHGVLKALMSGMLAGHAITEQARGAVSETDAIREYCAWVTNQFDTDVKALSEFYRLLDKPPTWVKSGSSGATVIQ